MGKGMEDRFHVRACAFAVLLASFASTPPLQAADLTTADVIFTGGKVLTVDGDFSIREAMAVKGDRVLATGTAAEMAMLKGPNTRVVELNGRTLMPGLIDTHLHVGAVGRALSLVDVGPARSMEEFTNIIGARVKQSKPGEWVITSGRWFETNLKENRLPTRYDLDKVSPNNPVEVERGHASIFNSYALKLAGLTKDSKAPQGGEIRMDPKTGEPTGILMDAATRTYFGKLLPVDSPETIRKSLILAQKEMNATGLTGVTDPGMDLAEMRIYRDMEDAGELTVRTGMMLHIDANAPIADIEHTLRSFPLRPHSGDDMLWVHGVGEITQDGGPHNAYMREAYANNPSYKGMEAVPREKLAQIMILANDLGWRPGIHAVGDAAIDDILYAYEAANAKHSIIGKRWELLHAILPAPDQYARINALQLNVTTQTMHNWSLGGNFIDDYGMARANQTEPVKTWLEKLGVRVSGGTDGGTFPYDQMLLIWMELTRKIEDGRVLAKEQAISLPDAIRFHTINGAYATFDENKRGSLEPGKYADLIVLSKDIMAVPTEDIRNLKVMLTMVGGKVVYGGLPGIESK